MCWLFFIFSLIKINFLLLLKIIFSIGIIVSKFLGISAPVITSTASNLFVFFNDGLSPADIVFKILKLMVLGGLIGQILGWLCFEYLDDSYILILIGLLALSTSIRYFKDIFIKDYFVKKTKKILELSYTRAIGWCGFSGFSSFVALTGGIPAQIFLLPLGLERQLFVGTMSFYFLIINLAKLPFFFNLEVFSHTSILLSFIVLPILPLGIYLGKFLNKKLSDKLFYHISHFALFLCGINLISKQIL
mgnify:CR=1 FL=1